MDYSELLNTQKDQVFEIIKVNGFNPNSFQWKVINNIPRIEYKNSKYFFEFYMTDNPFRRKVIFSPGEELLIEQPSGDFKDWNYYLAYTTKWLLNLKRELDTTNYWQKIEQESSLIVNKFDTSFDLFTPLEQELIIERISLLGKDVANLGIDAQDIEKINEKLEHIAGLVDKLTKTDWFNLLIGSIISLFLSLMITTENVKMIWGIVRTHFGNWIALPK